MTSAQDLDFSCQPGLLGFFGSSDVAVVVMDDPGALQRYAQLPHEGQVGDLRVNAQLTAIGYGVEAVSRGGGVPQEVFLVCGRGCLRLRSVVLGGATLNPPAGPDSGGQLPPSKSYEICRPARC